MIILDCNAWELTNSTPTETRHAPQLVRDGTRINYTILCFKDLVGGFPVCKSNDFAILFTEFLLCACKLYEYADS